ncbi:hypothetical protein BA177_14475 [Woeseia oceani]|uniref:Uncharacterized protein n=1 Tax=Woeseia oceani TaxID=1548547 RepID=A0A193LIA9_9GAMM|nr:hypothetical protein BA177_14475 [Woeseia oceani]
MAAEIHPEQRCRPWTESCSLVGAYAAPGSPVRLLVDGCVSGIDAGAIGRSAAGVVVPFNSDGRERARLGWPMRFAGGSGRLLAAQNGHD